MVNPRYLIGKELYERFISGFGDYPGLSIIPCEDILLISLDEHKYYIYLKNISHKGNPYPKNEQRAQLPKRTVFEKVKNSNIDFLFLGYDNENDIYVCWDPLKVRNRLNNKSYVSFYSFKDLQNKVQIGKIDTAKLSNGDKFVLFKREDVISFFNMIKVHFPRLKESDEIDEDENKNLSGKEIALKHNKEKTKSQDKIKLAGILTDVRQDTSVKLLLDSLISEGKNRLSIICACMNEFSKFYYNMKLTDWKPLIYNYLDEVNNSSC